MQDINHFDQIFDEFGVPVSPRFFHRVRQKYIDAAKKILPGFPHSVALHIRFFPINHLNAGHNKCPTGPVIQRQVNQIATKNKCLFIFSNDIKRAKAIVTAPCVNYIDPGEFEQFSLFCFYKFNGHLCHGA